MEDETKVALAVWTVVIAVVVFALVAVLGPARISRWWDSWGADAYGANWVVVQHAQDGSIINTWLLESKSIGNESNSDGIYFTDKDGSVVHLSGHYVYVQCEDPKELLETYLSGRRLLAEVPEEADDG